MGIIRPATPGFLVTLVATILLLVVSFSVPWFKSVYFLKANLSIDGQSGFITFGVLGYCTSVNGAAEVCSKAQVGYQFDPNTLLGDNIKELQIPTVVTKWITWALVLHIVALGLSGVSAIFGLLAHVREMSMACCSTCISGFAAFVALVAFIFDLVLFFVAKARINDVKGSSATIGAGIWLTLVAWILLFFSGCFYSMGRCCINTRQRSQGDGNNRWLPPSDSQKDQYADNMRLEAIKAEADRKARAAVGERGLPAFPGPDEIKPLSAHDDGNSFEEEEHLPYQDELANGGRPGTGPHRHSSNRTQSSNTAYGSAAYATGYTPGQRGQRAIDNYYAPPQQPPLAQSPMQPSYPPPSQSPPRRTPVSPIRDASQPTNYQAYAAPAAAAAGAAVGAYTARNYGRQGSYPSDGQYGHNQYLSAGNQAYGHQANDTSYHSAVSHPQEYSSYAPEQQSAGYSQNPPYAYGTSGYPLQQNTLSDPYNNARAASTSPAPMQNPYDAAYTHSPTPPAAVPRNTTPANYYAAPTSQPPQPSYSYNQNAYNPPGPTSAPGMPQPDHGGQPSYLPYPGETDNRQNNILGGYTTTSPPPQGPSPRNGPAGPRELRSNTSPVEVNQQDSLPPPDYTSGSYERPAGWAEKR